MALPPAANLVFREAEDRLAAGLLVAGVNERVQEKRVALRSRYLFFDEGAKNAGLNRVEQHVQQFIGVALQTGFGRLRETRITQKLHSPKRVWVGCAGDSPVNWLR